jgi:hypothetical protein
MLHLELRDREGYVGELSIRNDGTGTRESGNYVFTVNRVVGTTGRPTLRSEDGRVEGFPRLQLNAWDLVYRCLREAGLAERNP